MRSIVLPWYPDGHVLSKIQGRHLYLQDRRWEGSQKKKKKKKKKKQIITKTATQSESAARKTGAEGEIQELKNQAQPTHATAHSLAQTPKCQSPQFKSIW